MHNSFTRFIPTATALLALLLSGCAVEVQNVQPAQQLAQGTKPAGSVYAGWRLFQEKCAACHGPSAAGTANAPDLLPRVREMGPRQFVSLVLNRYDWNHQASKVGSDAIARTKLIDDIVARKEYSVTMPAWEGNPSVSVHIVDLYAYLSARAQGTQGPGRPAE
jgi:mono/diheme cytochrome c family protein